MAAKMNIMKFLQEVRGLAEFTGRRPASKPSAVHLMQFRSHLPASGYSRRRFTIRIAMKDGPDIPTPVSVTHVSATNAAAAPALS
jgi:hypothetical protein